MTDQQDITQEELPPCPLCGKAVDLSDADVLHPSGIYWREDGGIRHYVSAKERTETDMQCWVFNCPTASGGCGMSIDGDSKEEAVEKWSARVVNEENERLRAELERYLSTLHRIGQLDGFDIFNAPFMARQAVEEK